MTVAKIMGVEDVRLAVVESEVVVDEVFAGTWLDGVGSPLGMMMMGATAELLRSVEVVDGVFEGIWEDGFGGPLGMMVGATAELA